MILFLLEMLHLAVTAILLAQAFVTGGVVALTVLVVRIKVVVTV
jgi:hypothetical protein